MENPFTPLVYEVTLVLFQLLHHLSRQVYDRDVVGSDDFMGSAEFDLTSLEFNKSQEVCLNLEDAGDEDLIRLAGGTSSEKVLIACSGRTRRRNLSATLL